MGILLRVGLLVWMGPFIMVGVVLASVRVGYHVGFALLEGACDVVNAIPILRAGTQEGRKHGHD